MIQNIPMLCGLKATYSMEESKKNKSKTSEKTETKEKKISPRIRDAKGRMTFAPGFSGNPAGRPKGSTDFKAKMFKAMEKIAEMNGDKITVDEIEQQILLVGYKKAKEGDYQFYRDLFDRLYGKPQQSIDHTSKGEKLGSNEITSEDQELVTEFHEKLKKRMIERSMDKAKEDGEV